MIGIKSISAYIPIYRLNLEEIGKMWQTRTPSGEKAVAGYDEDAVTMAVAATLECMRDNSRNNSVKGLYFATTTAPYKEKQAAAIIASAADVSMECYTADFTNSLRAGSIGMKCALDAVKSGSVEEIIVVASDCRRGAPKGRLEQLLGDGAAAFIIGSEELIATIEGNYSVFSNFTDLWRLNDETFVQAAESRFIDVAGYGPIMKEVISGIMNKYSLTPQDFSKVVFYAHDSKEHAELAKNFGFNKSQVQDTLFAEIGNTGTPAAFIMLLSALEEAMPGDRILFVTYGDGADAFILRVTENISKIHNKPRIKDKLSKKIYIDYGKYLCWHDLIQVEPPSLPERPEPSIITRWREHKAIFALYGVKCKKCGTPQFPPLGHSIRVCIKCQAKDDFEDYKFSDKKGTLFTYALDQLQPTRNPPGLNGVVDFEGGGRLICELTDYEPDKVYVGMPVEMTFRKMGGHKTINYFWKARPILF